MPVMHDEHGRFSSDGGAAAVSSAAKSASAKAHSIDATVDSVRAADAHARAARMHERAAKSTGGERGAMHKEDAAYHMKASRMINVLSPRELSSSSLSKWAGSK